MDRHLEELRAYAARIPRTTSNSQWAYDVILGAILSRELASGQRLAEAPVAQAISLGRTPVREALMRLETEGFAASEPHVGLVVAGYTSESLAEIYEVREVLEAFACRMASAYAREADLLALRRILEQSVPPTVSHDVPRLRTLNTAFHEAIHVAARNRQLRQTLRQLVNRIRVSPVSAFSVPGRPEDSLREHEAILAAITDRDGERAAALAAAHHRLDKELRLRQMTGMRPPVDLRPTGDAR